MGYREAGRELANALHKSRYEAWDDLCSGLKRGMWGRPHITVVKHIKAKAPPPSISIPMIGKVMNGLFSATEGVERDDLLGPSKKVPKLWTEDQGCHLRDPRPARLKEYAIGTA